jgi:hypothetical protein
MNFMKKIAATIFALAVCSISLCACNNAATEYSYPDADKYTAGGDTFLEWRIKSLEVEWVSGKLVNAFSAVSSGGAYLYGDGSTAIEIRTVSGNAAIKKSN